MAGIPAMAQSDEDYYNQVASMEYKQWKFTPKYYYYSWYRVSIKVLGVKISWDEPGLGIHDNGPMGIGGGDGYVNQKWRQMLPLRGETVTASLLSSNNTDNEKGYWGDVFAKDLVTYFDRGISLAGVEIKIPILNARSITKDETEEVSQRILDMLFKIEELDKGKKYEDLVNSFRLQYDAIHQEMDMTANVHEDNAKRLKGLQKSNDRLRKLHRKVGSAYKLVSFAEDSTMKAFEGFYPTSFRKK